MKLSKTEKKIKKALEIEFCRALLNVNPKVIESMNLRPCYLGSTRFFESTAKVLAKAIKKKKKGTKA